MAKLVPRGLYAITPDIEDTSRLLALVACALRGGAAIVQYRNKHAAAGLKLEQASALARLCKFHGVPLIVNDSATLALQAGADGAHLGADDGDLVSARQLLGPGRILGASCYNGLEMAQRAVEDGADYVAFGSFYPSPTKPAAVSAGLALIQQAKLAIRVPVAVIGGINTANAAALINAGADYLCVISALFEATDVAAAADKYAGIFRNAENHHPTESAGRP